jgi:predicted Zn-dependent protease
MFSKIKSVTAIGLLLLVTALVALSQPPAAMPTMDMSDSGLGGSNSIGGMISGASGGMGQRRIAVRLLSMTRGERTAFTDEQGRYAFRGLPSGDYSIVVDKEKEYEPMSQNVTVMQLRGMPGQSYTVNFRLEPRREMTAKPGVVSAELAKAPPKAVDLFKKGMQFSSVGKHKEAIEQLKLAIGEYPQFGMAYNELGVQYLKTGDVKTADENFLKALDIQPDSYNALVNHGIAVFTMRMYKEAETTFRQIVSKKDDQAVGHYFLGQTLASQGKFEEGEKELARGIKMGGPEMKEGYRLLAIIHNSLGENKKAADDLEAYLKLTPKAPDAPHLKELIDQYRAGKKPGN